jgi:hypothetical protein
MVVVMEVSCCAEGMSTSILGPETTVLTCLDWCIVIWEKQALSSHMHLFAAVGDGRCVGYLAQYPTSQHTVIAFVMQQDFVRVQYVVLVVCNQHMALS